MLAAFYSKRRKQLRFELAQTRKYSLSENIVNEICLIRLRQQALPSKGAVQSGLSKSDNNDGKPVVINEKEKETQEKGKGKKEEKGEKHHG